MRQSKQLFLIASVCAAAIFSGCNSNTLGPSPYSAPSNLTYSQPNVVYVKDSTIVDNVPIVTGTVIRYSISPSLPYGLRFDDSSGIISGRPIFSVFPAAQYRVIATNSGGSDTVFITIAVALTPYYLAYASPQACAVGVATSIVPTALGNLVQFSVSPSLPSGLSLNPSTGGISGTANGIPSNANYTVTGINGKDSVKAVFRISVYNTPPSNFSYPSDSLSYVAGAFSYDKIVPSITGTVTHYSVSPPLPAGISLNDTSGAISGNPIGVSPAANYTVTASNALGSTSIVLNIVAPWMTRSTGAGEALFSLVWTGSQLVAVGNRGMVVTSPDGVNWTTRSSGTTNSLSRVIWGGGQLVAIGNSGTILTSPDGVVWTPRMSGTSSALNAVTWTGSQFIVVGNGGAIVTSMDGVAWTKRNSGVTNNFASVAWTGAAFFVVGGSSGDSNSVFTSSNGVTWTSRTVQNGGQFTSIAWIGTKLVAVGFVYMATSTDGVTWNSTSYPIDGLSVLTSATWSGSRLFVTGYGSRDGLYSSSDGTVWKLEITGFTVTAFASTGTGLVVINNGTVLTSF